MVSFVSSTSALDTEYYVRLSDSAIAAGGQGVLESDDLEGARTGLKTGYGQTKWVAEKVLMEASKRGLSCRIVRPGYVVGDSKFAGRRFLFTVASSTHIVFSHKHRRLYLASRQGLCPAGTSSRYEQHCEHGPSRPRSRHCSARSTRTAHCCYACFTCGRAFPAFHRSSNHLASDRALQHSFHHPISVRLRHRPG